MPAYAYAILAAAWVIWVTPFLLTRRRVAKALQLDRRARWGILLEGAGYTLLWQGHFWLRSLSTARACVSIGFLALAGLLSWTGARALGQQWRLDAGLTEGHDLVTSGPYRFVRHPIYASMLCLLIGTGVILTSWPLFAGSIVLFAIGTEIRVHVEDQLLTSRFGTRFDQYRRDVAAYVPFIR